MCSTSSARVEFPEREFTKVRDAKAVPTLALTRAELKDQALEKPLSATVLRHPDWLSLAKGRICRSYIDDCSVLAMRTCYVRAVVSLR